MCDTHLARNEHAIYQNEMRHSGRHVEAIYHGLYGSRVRNFNGELVVLSNPSVELVRQIIAQRRKQFYGDFHDAPTGKASPQEALIARACCACVLARYAGMS